MLVRLLALSSIVTVNAAPWPPWGNPQRGPVPDTEQSASPVWTDSPQGQRPTFPPGQYTRPAATGVRPAAQSGEPSPNAQQPTPGTERPTFAYGQPRPSAEQSGQELYESWASHTGQWETFAWPTDRPTEGSPPAGGQPTNWQSGPPNTGPGQPTPGPGQSTTEPGQPTTEPGQPTSQPEQPTTVATATGTAPVVTASQAPGSLPGANSCPSGQQMITIQNNSGQTLYVDIGPGYTYTLGNCATIENGATCKSCQPAGSAGNLQVGTTPGGGACGSWIEGNALSPPTIDISIIPGYTVPILCTASDGSTTGFTSPLCSSSDCSAECSSGGGTWNAASNSCENPTGLCFTSPLASDDSNLPFFEPVGSSAYYYPVQPVSLGYSDSWMAVNCVVNPPAGTGST